MEATNRGRYNKVWKHASAQEPHIWPSWEIVKDFQGKRCLEIGCGNYPKLPLEDGFFLDLSEVAASSLRDRGLTACVGSAENLPFADNRFDLTVAWEVLEHIDDHEKAFSEIARVLKKRGALLLSVPLDQDRFSQLDAVAGHKRRYEPQELARILKKSSLSVVKFRCPQLLKRLSKIPGFTSLLNKLYSCPAHTRYFGLPRPLLGLLTRVTSFLIRISSGPWKTGALEELRDEAEINVLCRKTVN